MCQVSLDLLHGDGLEAGPDEEGLLLILLGPSLSCELSLSLLLLLLTTAAAALLGLLVKRAQPTEQLSLRDPPVLHPEQRGIGR